MKLREALMHYELNRKFEIISIVHKDDGLDSVWLFKGKYIDFLNDQNIYDRISNEKIFTLTNFEEYTIIYLRNVL